MLNIEVKNYDNTLKAELRDKITVLCSDYDDAAEDFVCHMCAYSSANTTQDIFCVTENQYVFIDLLMKTLPISTVLLFNSTASQYFMKDLYANVITDINHHCILSIGTYDDGYVDFIIAYEHMNLSTAELNEAKDGKHRVYTFDYSSKNRINKLINNVHSYDYYISTVIWDAYFKKFGILADEQEAEKKRLTDVYRNTYCWEFLPGDYDLEIPDFVRQQLKS